MFHFFPLTLKSCGNLDAPPKTIEYRIIECGTNTDVYDHVYINDTEINGDSINNTNYQSFDSGWKNIKDTPSMTFENHVDSTALRTLSFKKVVYDQFNNKLTAEQDDTKFNFRLSLSKNSSDTLSLANMYKYYVTNPDGYLCKWDVLSQNFIPTENKFSEIAALTNSQKEQVTFETSMNGAISKIPAGYTVHVPNLPVGTKFMVVERNSEIPLGYELISYERVDETYFVAEGDSENTGYIRENDSPFMLINNKRGWGLEANKIWSDNDYTSSHDAIYTAVYLGEELVTGTIRKISHPDTSVRYYFDKLTEGTDYDDYSVREVTVENPVLASDGKTVLSYSSIKKLDNGKRTKIGVVSKSGVSDTFPYIVEYTEGKAHNNIKTDTITNTRTGGVVITLYDMNTRKPLANGIFVLKQGDNELGTFTSDSNGRVTVMYDFTHDIDYTLTEITPPQKYIGLPNSAVFSVDSQDDSIHLSGNESQWQSWRYPASENDLIIAYIDLFNKPYTLKAVKKDSLTSLPLSNAHFALYRGIQGIGGYVRDINPIPNYEDLITDSDGIIPFPNSTLLPGRYYLTENIPPENYQPLDSDVIFTLSESGDFIINSEGHESFLDVSGVNEVVYSLNIPNTPLAELTVTKTVHGNFGNVNKDFTFTLTVEGASVDDEYEWSKNGTVQTSYLHSGETFTLKHNDTCTIVLPEGKNVTISENSENYISSFQLGSAPPEKTNNKTFTLNSNITLAVTNTLDGVLPTGIKLNMPVFLLITVGSLAAALFILHLKKLKNLSE